MGTAMVNKNQQTALTNQSGTGSTTPDFGQPEYTTINKKVGYGYATASIKDGEIKPSDKKELVVMDAEDAEKLADAGHFDGSVVSTSVTLPANWAAIREMENKVYTDKDGKPRDTVKVLNELVTLFRPGMNVKSTNRRNQRLLATDEKGNLTFNESELVNDVLDLTSEITSESLRVMRTEEQKTWDNLSNLLPEIRETVWKAYLDATGKEFYIPSEAPKA